MNGCYLSFDSIRCEAAEHIPASVSVISCSFCEIKEFLWCKYIHIDGRMRASYLHSTFNVRTIKDEQYGATERHSASRSDLIWDSMMVVMMMIAPYGAAIWTPPPSFSPSRLSTTLLHLDVCSVTKCGIFSIEIEVFVAQLNQQIQAYEHQSSFHSRKWMRVAFTRLSHTHSHQRQYKKVQTKLLFFSLV